MIRIIKTIYNSVIKGLLYLKYLMDEGTLPIPFTNKKRIDIAIVVFLTIYSYVSYRVWFTF